MLPVTLNPALVPEKYHDFMHAAIRRIYFDAAGSGAQQAQELQMRVATLEARVRDLKHDKLMLMSRAESSLAAARAHAEGEAKASRERDQAQDELEEAKKKYHALKKKFHKLKQEIV
jgi:polyhydroxyalkanoate synthesis regulator phasin